MNAQSTLRREVRAMLKRYSASAAGAPARSNSIRKFMERDKASGAHPQEFQQIAGSHEKIDCSWCNFGFSVGCAGITCSRLCRRKIEETRFTMKKPIT